MRASDSGPYHFAAHVADPDAFEGVLNGNPFDNPGSFQSVMVSEGQSARSMGRFSLVRLDYGEPATAGSLPLKYGATDETSKLNINALYALDTSGRVLHDALMKLENMTDDIAWSIVDWIDPDEEPNAGGAEANTTAREPPYQCKNAPLDTIEELLW
jgi:type II secretory pathway component PulK